MSFYLNRTICEVFEEMRKVTETLNFSYLKGLIEEGQSMANRMEAGLNDIGDYKSLNKDLSRLRKEVQDLQDKRDELTKSEDK